MKKYFIGVLAALMLFAFTACEQQPIDMNGYIPATVSISQNSVIVAGQAITPDMFTTTVTYANGETGSANGQISFDMETIGQQPDQQSYIVAKVAVVGESKTISATTPVVITPVTALAISSISLSLSGREVFYALFFGTLGAWLFFKAPAEIR